MIDAKQAIRLAREHVREVFADEVKDRPDGGDFRLEEVEHADDDSWLVTISFLRPRPAEPVATYAASPVGAVAEALSKIRVIGYDATREYKQVRLTPDGQLKSLRVRSFAVSR